MKYLKKYTENSKLGILPPEQDPIFALAKIKEEYSIDKVKEMLVKEIEHWVPENGDPDFYSTSGNGEAEDVTINQLIGWFEKKYYTLSDENFEILKRLILKDYEFLNFKY